MIPTSEKNIWLISNAEPGIIKVKCYFGIQALAAVGNGLLSIPAQCDAEVAGQVIKGASSSPNLKAVVVPDLHLNLSNAADILRKQERHRQIKIVDYFSFAKNQSLVSFRNAVISLSSVLLILILCIIAAGKRELELSREERRANKIKITRVKHQGSQTDRLSVKVDQRAKDTQTIVSVATGTQLKLTPIYETPTFPPRRVKTHRKKRPRANNLSTILEERVYYNICTAPVTNHYVPMVGKPTPCEENVYVEIGEEN